MLLSYLKTNSGFLSPFESDSDALALCSRPFTPLSTLPPVLLFRSSLSLFRASCFHSSYPKLFFCLGFLCQILHFTDLFSLEPLLMTPDFLSILACTMMHLRYCFTFVFFFNPVI
ncbi:unnamed protein product [Gulo gulo]|uniref:Uncharacterized protein n=1 Tax=Gulo gulo TaxID=48420 RepID=A0A9X9M4X9_GULGU|nr:unnamed protein product [Gulo gulo]